MLKELMASIGIGSARVNLELENPEIEIGGTLEGVIQIKGGSVEQVVRKIYLNLVLTSSYGTGTNMKHVNRTVSTVSVADNIILMPEQELSIPVEFKIPLNLPISKGRTNYYLLAGLDFNQAINSKDSFPLTILPNKYMKMVFEAFSMLGFKEKSGFGDYTGMYQQLDYIPTRFMAQELDEIEIFPFANNEEILISMHVIKRTWGCFGSVMDRMDMDEPKGKFWIPFAEITSSSQLANKLKESIQLEYRACRCN